MPGAVVAGSRPRLQAGLGRFLHSAAGPLAFAFCTAAGLPEAAQASPIAPVPSWLQLDTGLRFDRETIDSRWVSVVRPAPLAPSHYSLAAGASPQGWDSGNFGSHIEIAPEHLSASEPQIVFRPQLVLGGGSSESLASWLRIAGINVAHCAGPVMKMHSGFADSSTHANVSVSARCSVH